jgi:dihydrofolate synthase / folylpolyglutamate synthase
MQKKEDILNKLFSLHRFGIKPGLERTLKLLVHIGNPHLKFPAVHVAGTNGKGSVCAMIASILKEAGYKVGLYTSPHLISFNERIRINKTNITDDAMVDIAEKLMTGSRNFEFTFFEVTTAMAFDYFAKNNVDIAIIETGMGGRFDSTNVITPLVSIITNISLDHKEYLGNSLEEIAFEKAGIIKDKVPVIITANNKSIRNVLQKKAKETNSQIIYSTDEYSIIENEYHQDFTQEILFKSKSGELNKLILDLPGRHQSENLIGALSAIELIKTKFPVKTDNISTGLTKIKENTGLRGRIELFENGKQKFILDTGHNPGAISKLIETLKLHRPDILKWNFVYGAMADKDIENILGLIHPVCDEIILTRPDIDRAIGLNELETFAKRKGFNKIHICPVVKDATHLLQNLKKPTVITGSFYIAGEALPEMEKMFKE